jgi:ATP-dependent Lhr-like helicase
LVFGSYPGSDKSLRGVQASAGLIYDVLAQYDPHHVLLKQALDEVLERTFNFARLQATLEELHFGLVQDAVCYPPVVC